MLCNKKKKLNCLSLEAPSQSLKEANWLHHKVTLKFSLFVFEVIPAARLLTSEMTNLSSKNEAAGQSYHRAFQIAKLNGVCDVQSIKQSL